jgi:hypothetical protein
MGIEVFRAPIHLHGATHEVDPAALGKRRIQSSLPEAAQVGDAGWDE